MLWRNRSRGFNHLIEQFLEFFQAGRGDDDGVASSADVFSDPQEASARIFLEGELEGFTLNLNFFRAERIFESLKT